MPDEKNPEDIESILSDLDAILTDMGGDAKPAPPKAAPPPPAPVPPAEPPKPAAPPASSSKIELPTGTTPAPAPKAEAPKQPGIELSPREGGIAPKPAPPAAAAAAAASQPSAPGPRPTPPPPPKPAEPAPAPKAPEPAKPAEPVAAAPAPAAVPAAAAASDIPEKTPKEQIRRVAYVHTPSNAEAKTGFAGFLSQAARTISKKPLFLREVLSLEVGPASDPAALVEKARQVKACAILAVVDGWPLAKVDDLSEACSRASLLFRSVAPADAQKKSTAVDIIVDMMLLPGEA